MALRKGSVEGVVMDNSFWHQKNVLITGFTGFKGGWLTLWLQSLGAKVSGYSLDPPTTPSLFSSAGVGDDMVDMCQGDIGDLKNLLSYVDKVKPQIIFHLAAQPLVRYSYDNPVETYASNVLGTVHLLESVRLTDSVKVVVVVTSDKCYENREWVWGYREDEPMGGYDPYSNSKGCAELVTAAYRNSYFNKALYETHGVGLATVRAGNVVGGGDWARDRLVPDAIKSFKDGQSVTIRNPMAVRPWQHVLDPLHGYIVLAEKLWVEGDQFSEAWNFGPDSESEKSVGWMVDKLVNLWGGPVAWNKDKLDQPHEACFLKLDSAKAKSRLGWKPKWNLDIGLKNVVEWYKAYYDGGNMKEHTLSQIKQYMES